MCQRVIDKCREEIEWAQANLDEMNLPETSSDYSDEDRFWFQGWLKAHKGMLELTGKETVK